MQNAKCTELTIFCKIGDKSTVFEIFDQRLDLVFDLLISIECKLRDHRSQPTVEFLHEVVMVKILTKSDNIMVLALSVFQTSNKIANDEFSVN